MKIFLTILNCFAITSQAFAGQMCNTSGFMSRDGSFVPVVTCSESNLGSFGDKLSSSGMWGGRGDKGSSSHSYKSSSIPFPETRPEPPKIVPKNSQPIQPSYSHKSDLGILPNNQINPAKSLSQSIEETLKSIEKSQSALSQSFENAFPQPAQPPLAAAFNIVKGIHQSVQNQINIETGFKNNSLVAHQNALSILTKAISDDANALEESPPESLSGDHSENYLSSEAKDLLNKIQSDLPESELSQQIKIVSDSAVAVASSSNQSQTARENAVAAVAMSMSASDALSNGDLEAANKYIQVAAIILDIALGFVNSVSPVNDLTQIAFGIATGNDYSGQPMEGIDYGLRALSVVLTFFPAAKIGSILINTAFINGAKILREVPITAEVFGQIVKTGKHFGSFVQVLGSLAPNTSIEVIQAFKSAKLAPMLFDHAVDLINRLPSEDLKIVLNVLKTQTIDLKDRWEIISSFKVGTLTVSTIREGDLLYRWSTNLNPARYYSTELIVDPSIARTALALPESNLMTYLREFSASKNMVVLKGEVAPNFGHLGGGTQVFVLPTSEELQFSRRLK